MLLPQVTLAPSMHFLVCPDGQASPWTRKPAGGLALQQQRQQTEDGKAENDTSTSVGIIQRTMMNGAKKSERSSISHDVSMRRNATRLLLTMPSRMLSSSACAKGRQL